MWTGDFWKATAERMIRMFAGAVLGLWAVGDGVMNAFNVDWQEAAGVGLGAALVSLLLSLGGNATTGSGPSFTNAETTDGRV